MRAFFIMPNNCPLNTKYVFPDGIREMVFFQLFPKFTQGDITFEKKINDGYYAQWACAGCTKSIGEGYCKDRKCSLGGKIIPESPGVSGYKITKLNVRKE